MNVSFLFRCLFLGAGLALAALAPAALSVPTEAAAAPPTISALQIKAAGTSATVTLTSSEPASVRVDAKATAPATALPRSQSSDIYTTAHELRLTALASNTTYVVTVTARTLDGRTATATGSFTTLKKRVRITLESIDIIDDGDLIGDGEPGWTVSATWDGGAAQGCYPVRCGNVGSFGEGRITPRNSAGGTLMFDFAEENFDRFPDRIILKTEAREQDSTLTDGWGVRAWECVFGVLKGGCITGDETDTEWRVPQGVETAFQLVTVNGHDTSTGFESVLTFAVELFHNHTPSPAPKRNFHTSTWR